MIFIFCITVTTALLEYVFPRGFSHLGLSVQWCKWQCCVEIFLEVDMMDQSFPNHELVGQWSENDIVLNLLHNLFSKVSCQVISWRCLLFRRADILVITTGSTITILYWVLIKINYMSMSHLLLSLVQLQRICSLQNRFLRYADFSFIDIIFLLM